MGGTVKYIATKQIQEISKRVLNGTPRVKIKTKIKERVTPHPLH
jgi:hypothetical protein